MSERELRRGLKEIQTKHPYALESYWRWIDKALADEPDVVKVLRWLRHQEEHTDHPVEWRRRSTYRGVARAIEAQFHVRLTDDGGWEYVEEAE